MDSHDLNVVKDLKDLEEPFQRMQCSIRKAVVVGVVSSCFVSLRLLDVAKSNLGLLMLRVRQKDGKDGLPTVLER